MLFGLGQIMPYCPPTHLIYLIQHGLGQGFSMPDGLSPSGLAHAFEGIAYIHKEVDIATTKADFGEGLKG